MRKLSMVRTVFKVRCIIYRTAPGDEFIPYSSSELASALAVYYCKEYQYYFNAAFLFEAILRVCVSVCHKIFETASLQK